MKISWKCFIIVCLMVLLPFVSKAGGPAGYVETLDPTVKRELIKSLGLPMGTGDYEIEMAMLEYLFRYQGLLRTAVPDIPPDRAVDTFICLKMINEHWRFERYMMDYNRCREFIK